jgi:hypothetical protein
MPHSAPHKRWLVAALVLSLVLSVIAFRLHRRSIASTASALAPASATPVEATAKAGAAPAHEKTSPGGSLPLATNANLPLFRIEPAIPGTRAETLLAPRFAVPSKAERAERLARVSELNLARLRSLRAGDVFRLPLFDGREIAARVKLAQSDETGQWLVGGELIEGVQGFFSLGIQDEKPGGLIMMAQGSQAYAFEPGRSGELFLVERPKQNVVCLELPMVVRSRAVVRAASEGVEEAPLPLAAAAEFELSSRPSATAVAYLDFDGETVTESLWNSGTTINATASGLSAAQITEVWRRVAEDYRAFNIDVTTNRARYDSAPVGGRMRCIITQNSAWYGAAGGVAYLTSWASAGTNGMSATIPCWVFADRLSSVPRYIAEATSHEIGHTLGLAHDGLMDGSGNPVSGYYSGHGSGPTGWAPIMGVGYYRDLVQWSKGEYVNGGNVADNNEDDLAIITDAANRAGYAADEAAATRAEASALRFNGTTSVSTIGTIERSGETDMYAFVTGGGALSFNFVAETGEGSLPNLDARATLYDASGNTIATSDPTGSLFPAVSATVAGGTYYLAVTGVGEGAVNGTGYSNYGSQGRYEITGFVPAAAGQPPVIGGASTASATINASFSYQIEALGGPTSYGASGLPAGVAINTASGFISGTPTVTGTFNAMISATNASGTSSKILQINVTPLIGAAVEAAALSWTTGGNALWTIDSGSFHDGNSAARSGVISHNRESWMEVTLSGPGTLTFWWRVSSQSNGDFLRLRLDGVEQFAISGSVNWAQRSLAIPAGTHTVRWVYTKNGSSSSGSDAGWVDGVVYAGTTPPPVITSGTSARAVIGLPFSYQISATNTPTSYNATGLPPGLSVNTASGLISGTPTSAATLGINPVNLSASNAGGSGSATLQLDVESGFSAWTQDNALSGAAALTSADSDGDGAVNLLEYGFALNPAQRDSAALPAITIVNDGGVRRLEVLFVRPPDRPDLMYTVEVSSDLITWTPGHRYGVGASNGSGLPTQEIERVSLGAAGERIRVRDIAGGGGARRFIRVNVTTQ